MFALVCVERNYCVKYDNADLFSLVELVRSPRISSKVQSFDSNFGALRVEPLGM